MLLSAILLIASFHYLNEQLERESINVISMFFLLGCEQHGLYPCSVTAACPNFSNDGENIQRCLKMSVLLALRLFKFLQGIIEADCKRG